MFSTLAMHGNTFIQRSVLQLLLFCRYNVACIW